jgi:hypothetical protein
MTRRELIVASESRDRTTTAMAQGTMFMCNPKAIQIQTYHIHAFPSKAVLNRTTGVLDSTLDRARKSAALS